MARVHADLSDHPRMAWGAVAFRRILTGRGATRLAVQGTPVTRPPGKGRVDARYPGLS